MQVVKIRQRSNMLTLSRVSTTKIKEDDPKFEYDKNGGNQIFAW